MLKNIIIISAITSLTACSGIPASTETATQKPLPDKITLSAVPMILDPTQLPPEPGADNNKTVNGIDSNNNGIRDDVERWIAQTYPTSARMRAAMAQMSLNSQKEITTVLTKDTAYQIGTEGMNATHCAGDVRRTTGLGWDVQKYIIAQYNTRNRYNAYLNFQNTMGSRAFMSPRYDTCDIPFSQLPN